MQEANLATGLVRPALQNKEKSPAPENLTRRSLRPQCGRRLS